MNALMENIKLSLKQMDVQTEKTIARMLFNNSMSIATAESCTGGLISSRLTDIPGSSLYTKENFVTYSNESKIKQLGVSPETLKKYGAVSEECALEMVQGLFEKTHCDIALVTTGIAGPDGGSDEKPVGTIFIGIKNKYTSQIKKIELNPNFGRKKMKYLFSQAALDFLMEFLEKNIQPNN